MNQEYTDFQHLMLKYTFNKSSRALFALFCKLFCKLLGGGGCVCVCVCVILFLLKLLGSNSF